MRQECLPMNRPPLRSLSLLAVFLLNYPVHGQARERLRINPDNLPKGRHQLPITASPLADLKELDIKLESEKCLNWVLTKPLKSTQKKSFEFWFQHLSFNCWRNAKQKSKNVAKFVSLLERAAGLDEKLRLHPQFSMLREQVMFGIESVFLAQPPIAQQKKIIKQVDRLKLWFDSTQWDRYLTISGQKVPSVEESIPLGATASEAEKKEPEKPDPELLAAQEILRESSAKKRLKLTRSFLENYPNSDQRDELLALNAKVFLSSEQPDLEVARDLDELFIEVLAQGNSTQTMNRISFLFYRGRTSDALALGNLALDKMKSGPDRDYLALQVGRLEHFIGDYSAARKKFKDLTKGKSAQRHEAAFSLGLGYMREREWKKAAEAFEIINSETEDSSLTSMALNYLYFLYQKLKMVDKEREIKTLIITDYALTYAGLRINLSLPENERVSPWVENDPEPVEVNWSVTAEQSESFARFKDLIKVGWYKEAQVELTNLPKAESPKEQALMSELEIAAHDYRAAAKRLFDLWNVDPSWRSRKRIESVFPRPYKEIIEKYAALQGLDPFLVTALIRQESSFDRTAVSVSDARGLMQLLVPSALEAAQLIRLKTSNMQGELFDPESNIRMGEHYLRRMMRMFDDNVPLALSAYNAGPGRLKRWLQIRNFGDEFTRTIEEPPFDDLWIDELPWPETRYYSKAILRNWMIYRLLFTNDNLRDFHPVWKRAVILTN